MTYTEELRLAPAVTYPWTFSINAEGLAVKPQTVSDVSHAEGRDSAVVMTGRGAGPTVPVRPASDRGWCWRTLSP